MYRAKSAQIGAGVTSPVASRLRFP